MGPFIKPFFYYYYFYLSNNVTNTVSWAGPASPFTAGNSEGKHHQSALSHLCFLKDQEVS